MSQQIQSNSDASDSGLYCEALTLGAVAIGVAGAIAGGKAGKSIIKNLAKPEGKSSVEKAIKNGLKGGKSGIKNTKETLTNAGKNLRDGIKGGFAKEKPKSLADLVSKGRTTTAAKDIKDFKPLMDVPAAASGKPSSIADLVSKGRTNMANELRPKMQHNVVSPNMKMNNVTQGSFGGKAMSDVSGGSKVIQGDFAGTGNIISPDFNQTSALKENVVDFKSKNVGTNILKFPGGH